MDNSKYLVFFVSDSTAITAEKLGLSLLSQFPGLVSEQRNIPFVNSLNRANNLIDEFRHAKDEFGTHILVFATMPDKEINSLLEQASCHYYELFNCFVDQISRDLNITSAPESGMHHGMTDIKNYDTRMDVVNYALTHDDAISFKHIDDADVILIGVSRCGKTPTCLYLALHYGLKAANYPLTQDDFEKGDYPQVLKDNKDKLVALTISPQRLATIREKRRSGGPYSTLKTCQSEVRQALQLFKRYQLTVLDTSSRSIEELSAQIVHMQANH